MNFFNSVKIFGLLLCFLFGTVVSFAQTNYSETMISLKLAFEEAETKEEFIELKNKYARIAVAEPKKWLPSYYETLCALAWAFEEKDEIAKAKLADQIELMLTNLDNRVKDNGEISVLKGRLLQLKVGIRSDTQLQTGLQLFESIGSTVEKYPTNPRALLLMGQIIMFSPKNFMGFTNEQGIEYIQKSVDILKDVEHTSSIEPTWGYVEASGHLNYFLSLDPKTKLIKQTSETPNEINEKEVIDAFYKQGNKIDYQKEADHFGTLINEDPSNAIWHYYQALCYIQLGMKTKKLPEVDSLCDTASKILKEIPEGVEIDEVHCLNALLEVTRIRVDYNSRGLKHCLKSETLLDKAIKLNPNNPRAYFLKAQNKRHIPKEFGGGMEGAKQYFLKSKELFESDEQSSSLIRWGKNEVDQFISKY